MEVRTFKEEDFPKIRELVLSILTKEYPFDKNCYSDSDLYSLGETYRGIRNNFFVIEEDGKIIGTIGIKEETEQIALMRRLFVDSNFRRRGYGKLLVDKAIEFCKNAGYRQVVFRTTNRMMQAIELCRKKGFKQIENIDLGGFRIYRFSLDI